MFITTNLNNYEAKGNKSESRNGQVHNHNWIFWCSSVSTSQKEQQRKITKNIENLNNINQILDLIDILEHYNPNYHKKTLLKCIRNVYNIDNSRPQEKSEKKKKK